MKERDAESVPIVNVAEQVTLLGLTWLAVQGETPARPEEIRAVCDRRLDEVTDRLRDGAIVETLSLLADGDFVEQVRIDDRSPVGKGKPAYTLGVDIQTALETLQQPEQITALLDAIEQRTR